MKKDRIQQTPQPTDRSPGEVLDILKPTRKEPRPLRIGGLWKTGPRGTG